MNNTYVGNEKGQAYACYSNNDIVRQESSSGGIFTLIAEYIISNGGIVFGAAFDENLNLHHIAVDNTKDLFKLRGAKYLQSSIEDTYKEVKYNLENNRIVLFTGTPCQISGLKAYLGEEYDNLFLQDIVCHGVPSPKVWREYLNYIRTKTKKQVAGQPFFRSKINGWTDYNISISFSDNTVYNKTHKKDLYMQAFLKNLCLRPSCYQCHSKSLKRESDITLADYWTVNLTMPEMFDDKGTSLIFINSEKGKILFNAIADKIVFKETDINASVKWNKQAFQSVEMPAERDMFMKEISSENFEKITKKYTKEPLKKRLKNKLRLIIKGY